MIALDNVRNLESHKLVKEGNLVDEKLHEFVRVANAIPCGHMVGHLHAVVERFETLVAFAAPDLGEAHFYGVGGIFLAFIESGLEIRDAEDGLKGSIDPAGAVLVAEAEHLYLRKAEKSVRNGAGSVLDE
jgi:hypothetical protein